MAQTEISPRQLAAAKKQYLGQLILANENRENRAIAVARATLKHGVVLTRDEIIAAINAVSASDLCSMAHTFTNLSSLTLGPK
jgi:predicted Zn-dependent peptidase